MGKRLKIFTLSIILSISLIFSFVAPAFAIQNGQPDGNGHPYVCMVVFYDSNLKPLWRTTGVLISSNIVLTAGHGTYGTYAASVWFESDINPQDSTQAPFAGTYYPIFGGGHSVTGISITNPYYRSISSSNGLPGYDYHDVGIVKLSTPAPVTQYASLPAAGLVDALPMKQSVDLVGYGVNFQLKGRGVSPGNSWVSLYKRYSAQSALIQQEGALSSEFLKLTENPGQGKGGIAFGDSGGPILLGGTNIILGLNSFVTNYNCSGVSYAQRIDIPDILEWIKDFLP